MKRACPTILELLAFDAVARYGSMTVASEILCISVSAVSKQIAALEKYIGKPLLRKDGRGVRLTSTGRGYWVKISASLRKIESATYEARADGHGAGVLTLASAPTFLTKWLIPRLADFRKAYPDITFSFRQHLELNEALPADVDAAIRYGAGDWPDAVSDYVAGREFVCIHSPGLFDARQKPSPGEVISRALLHHEQALQAWRQWAALHDLEEVRVLSGPRFAQYSAVIQAVLSGLGIGLVPKILVEEELKEGRVLTFGQSIEVDQGHYLCYSADKIERPVFATFRTWLLRQAQE